MKTPPESQHLVEWVRRLLRPGPNHLLRYQQVRLFFEPFLITVPQASSIVDPPFGLLLRLLLLLLRLDLRFRGLMRPSPFTIPAPLSTLLMLSRGAVFFTSFKTGYGDLRSVFGLSLTLSPGLLLVWRSSRLRGPSFLHLVI